MLKSAILFGSDDFINLSRKETITLIYKIDNCYKCDLQASNCSTLTHILVTWIRCIWKNERTLWWITNLKTYYFYGVCMMKKNLHASLPTVAADTQFQLRFSAQVLLSGAQCHINVVFPPSGNVLQKHC